MSHTDKDRADKRIHTLPRSARKNRGDDRDWNRHKSNPFILTMTY